MNKKARQGNADRAHYPDLSPMSTGMAGRCPRCGEGRLFKSMLRPVDRCGICGLDMGFAEEGDGPAVFVILIFGFLIAGLALVLHYSLRPPVWLEVMFWIPVTTGLCILALRWMKGIMIATQYRTGAEEGRLADR